MRITQSINNLFPSGYKPYDHQNETIKQIIDAVNEGEKYIVVNAPTGCGKAQPSYSKIKTPNGWTTMGEIKIGDTISNPEGCKNIVTHIHPQGKREVFEILFKDGRKTYCCKDHLWEVFCQDYTNKWKIINTLELQKRLIKRSLKNGHKIFIRLIKPIKNNDIDLPIDPYVLGCLLGDGGMTHENISFTNNDSELISEFEKRLDKNYILNKSKNKYGYTIIQKDRKGAHPYKNVINSLELLYKGSHEKFIPDIYKKSSIKQRILLIQGLLDTDGYTGSSSKGQIGRNGKFYKTTSGIEITTTSKQLANDIIELIRSIGGICYISRDYIPTCIYKGIKVNGKRAYRLRIRYHNPKNLFKISRKRDTLPKNYQYKDLKLEIVSIKTTNKYEECKCITVNHPNNLYITDDYIVTHNSLIAKTLANACDDVDPKFERLVSSYDAYKEDYVNETNNTKPHGAFVLTTTKQLQNQYVTLFNDGVSLKGKGNYQCQVDNDFSVELAPCTVAASLKKDCWATNKCLYYNARNLALISKFSILNYSKFFKLPYQVKKRNIIICDECSELENEFVSNFSCKIVYKKLAALKIEHPKLIDDTPEKANAWLGELGSLVDSELGRNTKSRYIDVKKWDTARQIVLTCLRESIKNVLSTWSSVHYVIERNGDYAEFVPYKVAPLASELFDYAEHYILMSATIVNHRNYAKSLGIKDYKYIEVPSIFNPKKSPIYCNNKYPLSYNKMKEYLPKVIEQIVQIAKAHENEKGIIHTHSFEITQAVQHKLHGSRYLYREEGSTNEDILKEHVMRKDSTVLISPSLTMGVDLKGDLGKWQIIVKLPYPSLGSKRIKMLFEEDKEWYNAQMLKVLVQASGRCTRSEEDEAITYILDGNIIRILKDNRDILPKHFLNRIV